MVSLEFWNISARGAGWQLCLRMGTNGWFGVPYEAITGDRLEGVKKAIAVDWRPTPRLRIRVIS
jgi:hypothetical protein